MSRMEMSTAEKKINGIVYAIVFTVVVVSLSIHLTAFVYSHASPQSAGGYLLLSIGIAAVITPAGSYFLASYTADLIELQDRLSGFAVSDTLTGCLNRQAFITAVEREQKRMHRTAAPAAILLLDLDQFRILNSRYGHNGGDAVLKAIADEIKSNIRSGLDVAARWGGEEFVIMLAETSIGEAAVVGDRLRRHVEAMEIEHQGSRIKTTLTVGITDLHWAECLKQAIDRADSAVITAKMRGRNTIETTCETARPFIVTG